MKTCYHCGDDCDKKPIVFDGKDFCCNGCKTVYEIFSSNNLSSYYEIENNPGATPNVVEGKYDFLDNLQIVEKLLEFQDENTQVVNLYIPHIHCSSCIWILENLNKLNKSIVGSQVNFPKKTVRVTFHIQDFGLKHLVLMLSSIGYEPYISLDDYQDGEKKVDRSLIYKLGWAGFAFGNVMFLSFPEYFEVDEFWLDQYKHVFRWLMFAFSVPVVFYAAQSYFVSAFKGLRSGLLNIDVPIALGVLVLFVRSTIEIIFDWGSGFFDSLTGLVFFLLVGKFFQQKTYTYLSFERDYKSYFPIAVTKLEDGGNEHNIPIHEVARGDRLLIRNEELIPVDGILLSDECFVDYSFVTGEADPIEKKSGDKIYAGGKQMGGVMTMEVLKSVEQSYLTQLWGNKAFQKDKENQYQTITDAISKRFTVAILLVAVIATSFWLWKDASLALNVFTAVLIIACPCAIALSAPFTLGNLLHIFGRKQFYLKDASVIERLADIDTIIFDKTGTITTNTKSIISYEGEVLSEDEEIYLKSTLRASNHPLSRALYNILKEQKIQTPDEYQEYVGKGIAAVYDNTEIKVGSASFVGKKVVSSSTKTSVHISANNQYMGEYVFKNSYRDGLKSLVSNLHKKYSLAVLSGDNDGEKEYLELILPADVKMRFNQKPEDKLQYIQKLQQAGCKVMMVGDGLNDAGALAQSDVGIAISENVNVFSPACDAIMDAARFNFLDKFLKVSSLGKQIIKWSFVLSLIYNLVGLSFAVTGKLSPVVAAILMPLSSISIVVFTTVATNWVSRRLKG